LHSAKAKLFTTASFNKYTNLVSTMSYSYVENLPLVQVTLGRAKFITDYWKYYRY